MMKERLNVYTLAAGNKTLFWYEKAVAEMKARPTTDPTSWNYQAAIHGFNATLPSWSGSAPLPSATEQREFWRQCQHGSWYFLPWHRMYLAYFEQIVANTIVQLGGPKDWALPFWDYSDLTNPKALTIPEPFTTPANLSNALWNSRRDSNVIPARYVTLGALNVIPYTGDGISEPLGFGGPETTFSHSGRTHGALERQPHDLVHVAIGGDMGDPRTAALDPIFWLHHANIDRLWQIWINQGQRKNPVKAGWKNFDFVFHNAEGQEAVLAAAGVVDTKKILSGYTYQGVPATIQGPALTKQIVPELAIAREMPLEIIGANNSLQLLSSVRNEIKLDLLPDTRRRVSLNKARANLTTPTPTYLHFENIKGTGVPPVYDVFLNLPNDGADRNSHYAGSLPFFGIAESSIASEHQSGSGQHYALDISDLISHLRTLPNWQEGELSVLLEPSSPMVEDASIEIGRISLYKQ